jgi:hypothetical protein
MQDLADGCAIVVGGAAVVVAHWRASAIEEQISIGAGCRSCAQSRVGVFAPRHPERVFDRGQRHFLWVFGFF